MQPKRILTTKKHSKGEQKRIRYSLWILAIVVTFVTIGCEKPLSNPEEQDAIYRDLASELGELNKQAEEAQKSFEEAEANLEKIVPQTTDYRLKRKEYFTAHQNLYLARQKAMAKKVELNSRLRKDRIEYGKAYNARAQWSTAQESELYRKEKERRAAPLSWDQNLKQRLPASEKPKKEAKKEGGGE